MRGVEALVCGFTFSHLLFDDIRNDSGMSIRGHILIDIIHNTRYQS